MKKQILSEEFKRMQKLAGLITENLDETDKNINTFPSEDDIKAASKDGKWVTVDKNGTKYDVNYTVSSESDDEMSFGVYPSGGSKDEDEEQVAEFYTYDDLVNWYNFPSEDEIKAKGEKGDSVTISKDGKNYNINYTVSSESDDKMSFGVYDSEEGEDAEQIEEFYTYDELLNWFNKKN
jgi:hypothetical protein